MICGDADNTSGCHLAVFSEEVVFSCHVVATRSPLTLPTCRRASGIDYLSKNRNIADIRILFYIMHHACTYSSEPRYYVLVILILSNLCGHLLYVATYIGDEEVF